MGDSTRAPDGPQATQHCYLCGIDRPLTDFSRRVDDRYYRMFTACVSVVLARRKSLGPKRRLPHTDTERTCYLCLRVLSNERFTRRSNETYFSACKDCNKNVFGPRRRARMAGSDGRYTTAEWDALVAAHDRCPGCGRVWDEIPPHPGSGRVITADHIIPIAKGGPNTIDNIQPLCYSCNSRKGDREAEPA